MLTLILGWLSMGCITVGLLFMHKNPKEHPKGLAQIIFVIMTWPIWITAMAFQEETWKKHWNEGSRDKTQSTNQVDPDDVEPFV